MNKTYLKYTFVGYLRLGLEPIRRSNLKELYEEMLNNSSSVKEWKYYPRKRRYEVIIHQELPCFNFDTFIIDAVAELLQQLIETELFASNLVLIDGIFLDQIDGEYKLALDELRNFVHMIDTFYAKPRFLIMDSVREEILTKYKSWSICKELYNTLLHNPEVISPLI